MLDSCVAKMPLRWGTPKSRWQREERRKDTREEEIAQEEALILAEQIVLRDPNYDTLKLRLEVAHSAAEAAAVEARRRVRPNEGR